MLMTASPSTFIVFFISPKSGHTREGDASWPSPASSPPSPPPSPPAATTPTAGRATAAVADATAGATAAAVRGRAPTDRCRHAPVWSSRRSGGGFLLCPQPRPGRATGTAGGARARPRSGSAGRALTQGTPRQWFRAPGPDATGHHTETRRASSRCCRTCQGGGLKCSHDQRFAVRDPRPPRLGVGPGWSFLTMSGPRSSG